MRQWYAPGEAQAAEVECEPVVGGRFKVVMKGPDGQTHTTSGTYSEVVPGQRLVHSWQWEGSDSRTQVTVEFKVVDDQVTELTVTHELFADNDARDAHGEGWESCLGKLEGALS